MVFRIYSVELQVRDKILGGIQVGYEREENLDMRAQMKKEDGGKKKGSNPPHTTFKRNDAGKVCLEEKNVKGLLKECVATLYGRGRQSTITMKLVTRGVFSDSETVIADDVSGTLRRPVHGMTQQGMRTALQDVDYVSKPRVAFKLKVAAQEITTEILEKLLTLGQEIGLGATRTQGYGKYDLVSLLRGEE